MKFLIKNIQFIINYEQKNKLLTVVGTRPELIRLSRIIPSLDKFQSYTCSY